MKTSISTASDRRRPVVFPTDQTLIEHIISAAPSAAFQLLLEKYTLEKPLLNYFLRWGFDRSDALDLRQETLLAFYLNLRANKLTSLAEGRVVRYLFGMACNHCLKAYRQRRRSGFIQCFDPHLLQRADLPEETQVDEQVRVEKLNAALHCCLQRQSARTRLLVVGYYVENRSYPALALELGYASGQVARQRCSVKRRELREEIEKWMSAA